MKSKLPTLAIRKSLFSLGICTMLSLTNVAMAQLVSTLAGSGTPGSTDGTGTAASFNAPYGVAVDKAGNMFISDGGGNKIRKITPAGVVSTFAGSGAQGSANGTGTSATFYAPYSIAIDASDNLYTADFGSHKIRKITPAGVVTTIAGSGSPGSANGTGSAASFNYPHGIAVDASGNIFVSDYANSKIRKITPAGVVTTFAGTGSYGELDGTGTAASFGYITHMTIDASDNLYVCDGRKIRKITPSGDVTTLTGAASGYTGGYVDGPVANAKFSSLYGIAIDGAGNLYVTDIGTNDRIRRISTTGNVSTIAGNGSKGYTNGLGTAASFNEAFGMAVDKSGNLIVADGVNNVIRKVRLLPEIRLTEGSTDIFTGWGSYDFGNVPESTSSASVIFNISNQSTALNILVLTGSPKVSISGPDAAQFAVNTITTSDSIGIGGSTAFSITFSPSSIGSKTATVTIQNNDYDESSYSFTLLGNGTINTSTSESSASLFTISPNPTTDRITIETEQELHVTLYDAQGVVVMKKEQSTSGEISLSNLKGGIYILRCTNKKNQYQDMKVIRE